MAIALLFTLTVFKTQVVFWIGSSADVCKLSVGAVAFSWFCCCWECRQMEPLTLNLHNRNWSPLVSFFNTKQQQSCIPEQHFVWLFSGPLQVFVTVVSAQTLALFSIDLQLLWEKSATESAVALNKSRKHSSSSISSRSFAEFQQYWLPSSIHGQKGKRRKSAKRCASFAGDAHSQHQQRWLFVASSVLLKTARKVSGKR